MWCTGLLLCRAMLVDVKVRSMRKRVWLKTLSCVERALVDLTIRVVDRVRSVKLNRILSDIVGKLEKALENGFLKVVYAKGVELAQKLSNLVHSWDNVGALSWVEDSGFILYLGVSWMNTPVVFRFK